MRIIDAEKLWLTTEYTEDGKVHKYYEQFEVDNAPTIDAVPVIRCKDCMYADSYYHCTWTNFWGTADDYCSRAKPRMNEVAKWLV